MHRNDDGWLEKIGRVVKRLFRRKLDENSWIETGSIQEDWYCEPGRKFLFRWDPIDRRSVELYLPSTTMWEDKVGETPVTAAELAAISPKLQKLFEKDWGHCVVKMENGEEDK